MIYEPFDIVIVPFPFVDGAVFKKRPALVISSYDNFGKEVEHSILAMITSMRNKPWPLDTMINDLKTAGLPKPSIIRMKLFTLDNRLIIEKRGVLAKQDKAHFSTQWHILCSAII